MLTLSPADDFLDSLLIFHVPVKQTAHTAIYKMMANNAAACSGADAAILAGLGASFVLHHHFILYCIIYQWSYLLQA